MRRLDQLWWDVTRQWMQIYTFAPMVIGARLSAAATAGTRPSARHQAEMSRMAVEKGEALAESAAALWFAAMQTQQRAWQRAWRVGRALPLSSDYDFATATARSVGQAWRPISRRVTANAKRLGARKRRQQ
jgi:hypothetical protein